METTCIDLAHRRAQELFETHADRFGTDLEAYRGHTHRVIGLVAMQADVTADLAQALGVAAFFHDAAIWFDNTWDYLAPSVERALVELGTDDDEHGNLVTAMIDEHHRIRSARSDHELVEAFRLADRYDVYFGLLPTKGVSRRAYRELRNEYPTAGLRRMLIRAFGRGLRENPLRPMPMIKL